MNANSSPDNSSRQLLQEIGLRDFHTRLDQEELEGKKVDRLELAAAAIKHDHIRQSAQKRLQVQAERERQESQEKEQRAWEEEQQEHLDRVIAERKRETQAAEHLRELRRQAEEAQKRVAEAKAAAAQPIPQPARPSHDEVVLLAPQAPQERGEQSPVSNTAPPAPPALAPKSPSIATATIVQQPPQPAQHIAESATTQAYNLAKSKHEAYLAIHARSKHMRRSVDTLPDQQLKKRTGECRREIKKSVGQLTVDMASNTAPYNKVRSILNEAAAFPQPQIDIRHYIVSDIPSTVDASQASVGLIQIYLLNIFAKAVISQFINEAGVAPKAAEPIGTIAIRIFAANEFRWQGISLIDILIAKFHAICPVLFGMYRKSPATKKQCQGEALTGLGSGFASLSLRDFGKAKVQNPFPPTNYWQAIAWIVNTPPKELAQEHFIVLKALTEHHAGKFILFFGLAAVVALKKAIVELPQQAPKSAASSALSTLQATLRRDMNLTL